MRNAFADEITALADRERGLMLLSGDIGNRLFDGFKARHPERFLNCGVAEQCMTGVAAGLAMSGLRPVTYTITPFVTTRCLEQIRVDVCYHHLPVVIVGVGAGLSYASLGATHHACEDIAFLRALPGMTVVCPGDPLEVRLALREALRRDGPVYLRLGKKGEAIIHQAEPAFRIGKSLTVREGSQACLLGCGTLLPMALEAAARLQERGVSAQVESFHTVKPLDEAFLEEAFSRFAVVATVEEHSRIGGLGGAVAEWLSDRPGTRGRLLRFGTEDRFLHEAGEQEHAQKAYGLTAEAISASVAAALEGAGARRAA